LLKDVVVPRADQFILKHSVQTIARDFADREQLVIDLAVPGLDEQWRQEKLEDRIHLEREQRNKAEEEKEFPDRAEKRGTSTVK
jgi:hypothetical protein